MKQLLRNLRVTHLSRFSLTGWISLYLFHELLHSVVCRKHRHARTFYAETDGRSESCFALENSFCCWHWSRICCVGSPSGRQGILWRRERPFYGETDLSNNVKSRNSFFWSRLSCPCSQAAGLWNDHLLAICSQIHHWDGSGEARVLSEVGRSHSVPQTTFHLLWKPLRPTAEPPPLSPPPLSPPPQPPVKPAKPDVRSP